MKKKGMLKQIVAGALAIGLSLPMMWMSPSTYAQEMATEETAQEYGGREFESELEELSGEETKDENSVTELQEETTEAISTGEEPADRGFADAEWIPVNQSIYGSGSQYYKFTIDHNGYFTINLQHDMDENNWNIFYEMYVYDSNLNRISTWYTWGYKSNITTCRLGFPQGTYYIQIHKNYYTASDYSLCVNYTQTSTYETEFNNGFTTADLIELGTTYNGNLYSSEDEDYYKFRLSKKGYINFAFGHQMMDDDNMYYEITLYNSNQEKVYTTKSSGYKRTVTSGNMQLSAGTYYIKVTQYWYGTSNFTTNPYSIRVQVPTIKVTSIKLNKKWVGLNRGGTTTLKATVSPYNASNKTVTWKSSNTKVATVSSTGKVTAKATGTAVITCTAKDGSGKKATCKITVYNNTQAYVARIYTKALGRSAEQGGLNYWTNEIQSGNRTPVQVAEEFFFAPEFVNKKLNNTEYVKVLYRTFMGREYDKGGLDYWVARLNKGESRKSVLEAFAGCPEFQKIVRSFGL